MAEPCVLGHGKVVGATLKALCVRLDDADSDLWIPKANIHDDSEVYADDSPPGEIVVALWWAEEKGLT